MTAAGGGATTSIPGIRWGPVRRRALATLRDVPIVVGWLGFSTLVGLVVRPLGVIETPGGWDGYAFVTAVAPIAVTFAAFEAARRQATPGKARLGLRVVDQEGRGLTLVRSLVRSAVKFAPWQMAHTAVFHLMAGSTSVGLMVLSVAAQAIVVASAALMAFGKNHRALHDLIAGTRVVGSAQPA